MQASALIAKGVDIDLCLIYDDGEECNDFRGVVQASEGARKAPGLGPKHIQKRGDHEDRMASRSARQMVGICRGRAFLRRFVERRCERTRIGRCKRGGWQRSSDRVSKP